MAGNQSGKTTIGAYKHACYARGCFPEGHPLYKRIRTPNKGIIVTAKNFKDGIEDEIVPKIREVVGTKDIVNIRNNSRGQPATIHWKGGSITYLTSAEQEDMVFESKTLSHGWIDEPVRRSIYIGISRGMLTTGGHIMFTCTPLDEPWLYEEIYIPGIEGTNPDIAVFEGESSENKRISDVERDKMFKKLTTDEIETRWKGKFLHLAGRVFKSYQPDRNRIPPFDIPRHWPVWAAVDPHRNKPHAVLFLAVSPENNKYVCNEIFTKCTIEQLGYYILDIGSQYNLVNVLADTSIQEDGWGRVSARTMLEDVGLRVKLAQKKNLKASGIQLINQGFENGEIFVMDHCVRTHKELMNQVYKKNKSDEQQIMEQAQKKFDEMTDCLRYILVEKPEYGTFVVQQRAAPYQRRIK